MSTSCGGSITPFASPPGRKPGRSGDHHRQGRTSFAEWLKDEIFGRDYVEISDDPERLFGKHAEGRVGKILCSFNEASLAATASHEERLKAFIPDVSDAKGIRAREVSNYCRWFLT